MLLCLLLLMFNLFALKASSDIHLCESEDLELRYVFLLKVEVNPMLHEYFLKLSGVGLLNVFYLHGLIQITVDPIERESLYQLAMATNTFISDIAYCFHVEEVPALLMNVRKDPKRIYEEVPTLQDLVLAAEMELNIENSNMSQIADSKSQHNKSTSNIQHDVSKEFEGILYNVSIL